MNIRKNIPVMFLCAILGVTACDEQTNNVINRPNDYQTNKPDTVQYYAPFQSTSVFYDPVPANPEIDPNSATMVSSLVEQADQAFLIAVKRWTVPVFFADEATPLETVQLTANWAPKPSMQNVPIPEFADADPSEDAHMVIVDESSGCVYDFWEMRYHNSQWKAGWGNALPLDGDGIFPQGFSARGSGFELLQGIIWPQELKAGEINHALIFSYDHTKAGGPVTPATESDGTSNDDWAIPEGALVQLDPDLDLTSLGLNTYEMTIAKALQEYGMYCADDGGGISLYAINPISAKNNPYENIWGNETYIFLDKIPVDKFQVLKLPDQSYTEPAIVANSCAEFN